MVHLNQCSLTQQQLDRLFQQLVGIISPSNPSHTNHCLTELLGKEERIMLAKRLAVVVLLVEGTSKYKIGQVLKLSQSTVDATEKKMLSGHYQTILTSVAKTKKDYARFLDTLDKILHLGGILPHYQGLERYRGIK